MIDDINLLNYEKRGAALRLRGETPQENEVYCPTCSMGRDGVRMELDSWEMFFACPQCGGKAPHHDPLRNIAKI